LFEGVAVGFEYVEKVEEGDVWENPIEVEPVWLKDCLKKD
jgi:hypothetical protein